MHPFAYVMIATFFLSVMAIALGISKMGQKENSEKFMLMRVALCFLLLGEIIFYISFIK